MPDLKNFAITGRSTASLSVPRATLSGQVVTSDAAATVIRDFTGANAVLFPEVLGQLSVAERFELVEYISIWLLQKRGIL